MMRDVFNGFMILRLIALCALLSVGAVALGISRLSRGSDTAGGILLGAAVVFVAATAWLLAHRPTGRAR